MSNITVDSKKNPWKKRGERKSGIGDDERKPEVGLKKDNFEKPISGAKDNYEK